MNYLLINYSYFSIKETYPIFYITGIASFCASCALTVSIQWKWYEMVKQFEDNIKQVIELQIVDQKEALKSMGIK